MERFALSASVAILCTLGYAGEPAKPRTSSSEPTIVSIETAPWDIYLWNYLKGGIPAGPSFGKKIPPSCPQIPTLNGPGVLCEDFDTNRNGVPGFQFSRLPVGADPDDPLRAIGDPDDDVLGFAIGTGASPAGTAAATCPSDVGFPACATPVAEENDWHLHSLTEAPDSVYDPIGALTSGAPDGGKAHRGTRSMHWGRHLDSSSTLGDTIRFRQVSAFVLDSDGRNDPDVPGIVPGPTSTLEFWHIIEDPLLDTGTDCGAFFPCVATGGGQLQISVLGGDGRFERWRILTADLNGYNAPLGPVSVCSFDPGDDQVAPGDPTFCGTGPNLVWANVGDVQGTDATCETDSDSNEGGIPDCGRVECGGPGCTENGSAGAGVWARSAFDLSPFAGRVARLRWIGSAAGGWGFGESRSLLEPESGAAYQYWDRDDGWYLDDIVLTDLRDRAHPAMKKEPITP